ncbi:hypothetical protein HW555_009064 [Spodoptera exigua]|uniref:Uncharacterized protein n=1 Tax=Spodoptera exigua TaxID=7107 RepID=A0A835L255_SPOEX|nr:hypothetical protein HW555_009064 [Spodoptera exigua]
MWLNQLPAQIRAVLSVNTESSLEMLAVMADKMMEHFEPASINAVSTATTCQENLQIAFLSKQIEKLSLEITELRTNQQNHRHFPRFSHRNRSRSHSRSRQHSNIKPGDPNWVCRYHYRFGDQARKCESPCSKKREN